MVGPNITASCKNSIYLAVAFAYPIAEHEMVNTAGMGDSHDSINFLRVSCVISLEKDRTTFDPLSESRICMTHVMTKVFHIIRYMIL